MLNKQDNAEWTRLNKECIMVMLNEQDNAELRLKQEGIKIMLNEQDNAELRLNQECIFSSRMSHRILPLFTTLFFTWAVHRVLSWHDLLLLLLFHDYFCLVQAWFWGTYPQTPDNGSSVIVCFQNWLTILSGLSATYRWMFGATQLWVHAQKPPFHMLTVGSTFPAMIGKSCAHFLWLNL